MASTPRPISSTCWSGWSPAARPTTPCMNFWLGTGSRKRLSRKWSPEGRPLPQSDRLGSDLGVGRISVDRLPDQSLRGLLEIGPEIGMHVGELPPHHRIEQAPRRRPHLFCDLRVGFSYPLRLGGHSGFLSHR